MMLSNLQNILRNGRRLHNTNELTANSQRRKENDHMRCNYKKYMLWLFFLKI